ncbi:MAG TPA: helix-turn-helix domain-containing protein [Acidimicrobiales bacterium]|nr:helix-turn-helix domain-containing protein [Acidimicrobiales bacterium]
MPDDAPCSIARTLDVIGERWTLLILRDAFRGVRRFEDLQRDLGIARNILADRLQKLVERGILSRRPYQARPVRYEYRLTPKGVDLSPALVALMRWGDTWLADDAGPPLVLAHKRCGEAVELSVRCPRCDEAVPPAGLAGRPGPGARPTVAPAS